MKLAEALQQRADLCRKLDELKNRIRDSALTQEGEKPSEDPQELLQEYDKDVEELADLIARINLTNCNTIRNGKTLTELIAQKDALSIKLQGYREIADTAGQNTYRARNTEIRILTTVDVKELRKKADDTAKQIRLLDNTLHETNWTTELK